MDVMAVAPGPPPLTWERLATGWTLNPGALVVVAALGVAYWLGVRRLRRAGVAWPAGRSWWSALGLASILLVTVTFVGVYANTLFWDRAVRNIVLLMITPMFLAMGAPLTLLRDVLPERTTRAAGRILHSGAARVLTFPAVVTIALIAPLFVLYLTPLYEAVRMDQIIGAGVLWIGGDLAGLPFLAAVMTRMMREDQRDAVAIDAELDTLDALDASLGPAVTGPSETRPRLWWEDHPELAQRFRRPR